MRNSSLIFVSPNFEICIFVSIIKVNKRKGGKKAFSAGGERERKKRGETSRGEAAKWWPVRRGAGGVHGLRGRALTPRLTREAGRNHPTPQRAAAAASSSSSSPPPAA